MPLVTHCLLYYKRENVTFFLSCPVYILQVHLLTSDYVGMRLAFGCQGFENINMGVATFMLFEVVIVTKSNQTFCTYLVVFTLFSPCILIQLAVL
jgi:hypothetical protein